VIEYILDGTSAQLGYTVPLTLVLTWKYKGQDQWWGVAGLDWAVFYVPANTV